MASAPQTAPPTLSINGTIQQDTTAPLNKTSPPPESQPTKESPPPTTTNPSPPPHIASPPPDPPKSSPPPADSPPPPPKDPPPASSPPPPPKSDSPPPKNNDPLSAPPPASTPSPPSLPKTPSPPAPANTPPSPVLSPPSRDPKPPPALSPPPRPTGGNRSSSIPTPPKPESPSSPPSGSAMNQTAIIAIAVAGVAIIALLIMCVIFTRRKKKPPYYMEPGRPPKDPYYNVEPQWNSPQTGIDHMVKLPPPPGVMGTPVCGVGGWGAPPPPPPANTSSDFSSSYSGQQPTPMHPPHSPNMGGIGSKSQFTYEELMVATGGFTQSNLLGQGGFGFVHKGVLPDGREVAVKSLKSGSGQGEREFQAEVEIISRVHHRHLVSLVGYCIADGQRMLVYEFVPNKTLEFHLHGKGQPVMDWSTRLRIAVGSAKGLEYLHEDCHPRIIHRDIKAANILLDENFEAMVADFGLAKLSSDNYTHVSTRVMGTFGYLAPEYASSGKLTEKSDVFSFGVMLLELITGRRPVDPTNRTMEDSLVDWARPLLSKAQEDGIYDELVDPRLEENYAPNEMACMVACAAASIRHSARRRPKMSQIMRALDGDSSLEDLNEGVKPGQSTTYNTNGNTEIYDTRAYDADMMKFRKMVMNSQEFNSSEYGATSEYGLNPSSSSSDSKEMGKTPKN